EALEVDIELWRLLLGGLLVALRREQHDRRVHPDGAVGPAGVEGRVHGAGDHRRVKRERYEADAEDLARVGAPLGLEQGGDVHAMPPRCGDAPGTAAGPVYDR